MTQERLLAYRALRRESLQLREKLDEVQAKLEDPKQQLLSGMPRGGASSASALEDAVAAFLELEEMYTQKLEILALEQMMIEEAIESLSPTERALMRARYIDGKTWEQVCDVMCYSWSQVHRLHYAALQHLEEN